nr:MAG TPA: hypothetical protein [Caudoviricetes sp.]
MPLYNIQDQNVRDVFKLCMRISRRTLNGR